MPVNVDLSLCDSCGACVEGCTMRILQLEEGKLKIVDVESCIECEYCRTTCPRDAITIVAKIE